MNITNVILAGGTGTRLWPLSKKKEPKQFLPIIEGKSLFQKTIERNSKIVDRYLVIGNESHSNLINNQLRDFKNNLTIENLSESIGRNTAAAIAFAALNENKNTILFITPSDHLIEDQAEYMDCIRKAKSLAEQNKLVTFGVNPTSPDTGFGYIKYSGEKILEFKEKPDLQTALSYLKSDQYLWNSGMFMFKAGVYLEELKKHSRDIYDASVSTFEHIENDILPISYSKQIPDISIDYAVMEKTTNSCVVKSNFNWTDLGSFDSLVDYYENKNEDYAKDKLKKINTSKDIFWLGEEEIIYVEKADKILILPRGKSQDVKKLYNMTKLEKPDLL
jgi:mannose-1-phosphate guanylyltransferase